MASDTTNIIPARLSSSGLLCFCCRPIAKSEIDDEKRICRVLIWEVLEGGGGGGGGFAY